MAKRVGILTGGGDVPGLNAAIQQLVWRMEEEGYEVLGLRRGWAAPLHVKPYHDADNSSWLVPLTRASTRTIDRSGGTILHCSRINPALTAPDSVPEHLRDHEHKRLPDGRLDLTEDALEVLRYLHLDTLVAIGGDGTLYFARPLPPLLRPPPPPRRGQGGRPAEDHGQRRLRHRLLHRLLDGGHPLGQLHQRPEDGGGLARALPGGRAVRPPLRGNLPALLLPRGHRPGADRRGPLRPPAGGRDARRGQARQPQQLRRLHHLRGGLPRGGPPLRDRRGGRRGQPRARWGGPLSPRGAPEEHGGPGDLSAPGLSDALGPPRFARPPGGPQLRHPRRRPHPGRQDRPPGLHPGGALHHRAPGDRGRRQEAGERREVLRPRKIPAEHRGGDGAADVSVLISNDGRPSNQAGASGERRQGFGPLSRAEVCRGGSRGTWVKRSGERTPAPWEPLPGIAEGTRPRAQPPREIALQALETGSRSSGRLQ